MSELTDASSGGEALRQIRLEKAQQLRDLGVSPYALRTPDRQTVDELREIFATFADTERAFVEAKTKHKETRRAGGDAGPEPVREAPLPTVSAAGRVRQLRSAGKLYFIDVIDQTGKIQLLASKKDIGDAAWAVLEKIDLGDFVWARGGLGLTEKGELSIFATEFRILTKATLPPPNIAEKTRGKESAFSDAETRQRQRYLDLMMNEDSRYRFQMRSKIISGIRGYLDAQNYLEVETPMMQPLFGGARAKPFITHHNTLKMQLYLRIAPELYLKRLLVGGLERVYEINRNFRNEGIDTQHNPEFTMLELYEAFGDYHRMMELTEGIFAAALAAVGEGDEIGFQGRTLNFKRPWPRLRYVDLFHQHVGLEWGDRPAMEKKAKELGLDPRVLQLGDDWLGNELWEACCEAHLDQPCFVIDYPTAISPLAKQRDDDPRWVERFEAFACNGMELANAFSELNDPEEQRRRFDEQVREAEKTGDDEVPREIDTDYVTALSYGMPPAGGLGIGIDRLVMLLTDTITIRDVILFPLLRPRSADAHP